MIFEDVTLIDGSGKPPVEKTSILVEHGRVKSIAPKDAIARPPNVKVRHLPGRFVIPGLIDMHAHVTIFVSARSAGGSSAYRYDRGVSEQVLRTLLTFGITAVRNAAAPSAEGVQLRDDVAAGKISGPRIFTAGEAIDHSRWRFGPFIYVESERDVRNEVQRQAREGVDFIKLYAKLPKQLVAVAIQEAHAQGLKVIGHLGETSWTEAAKLGIDGICHGASWESLLLSQKKRSAYANSTKPYLKKRVDWLDAIDPDGNEIRTMISALVDHHVVVDPTLIAYDTKFRANDSFYIESPDLALVPEPLLNTWRHERSLTFDWTKEDHARARSAWPKLLALIKRYRDSGVRLVAGTDLPNPWVVPGTSLHRELELLASAGIPLHEVIQMATKNAAEALNIADETGTVEVGKWADMVVLTSNPLERISNTRTIEYVIQRGRILQVMPRKQTSGASSSSPRAR